MAPDMPTEEKLERSMGPLAATAPGVNGAASSSSSSSTQACMISLPTMLGSSSAVIPLPLFGWCAKFQFILDDDIMVTWRGHHVDGEKLSSASKGEKEKRSWSPVHCSLA
ncbi:uncharacterized protein LOC127754120 [Oryza glaberrima]|uniref:uncharacterized protein LOC127754120 n=1 Tax=Oryza glaberrima TaxID=4538 RepID=UPI00224C4988|nr:uncharacterized protein LOC127754120 [Oryza glaberrima]